MIDLISLMHPTCTARFFVYFWRGKQQAGDEPSIAQDCSRMLGDFLLHLIFVSIQLDPVERQPGSMRNSEPIPSHSGYMFWLFLIKKINLYSGIHVHNKAWS
jgi:hypothetical protein